VVVVVVASVTAPPSGVTAEREIKNPAPLAIVHCTPDVFDKQVNGPTTYEVP
jgi:hypothetical protein